MVGTDQTLAILHLGAGYYRDPTRAQRLFERYLRLERDAYGLWLRIGQIAWADYAAVGRELFEVSQELDQLWVSTFLDLEVHSLYDGESVDALETVMLIEGDYSTFAHLETVYLGALTDGTMVATNTQAVVEAANGKSVMMFGARHQGHELQASSGYAAFIGGAKGVSTDEQAEWWGSKGIGTIPHALIAVYNGDTVLTTVKFAEYTDASVNITSLVDFDNDCVGTSLAVARALGSRLWGVRVDTSENMVDRAIFEDIMDAGQGASMKITGVTPELIWKVRRALDDAGFDAVRIIASGGFTAERISHFEKLGVPIDVYGVGSTLFDGTGGKYDYTADVVRLNGVPLAKKGRRYRPNERLHRVDLQALSSNALVG
ncbi:MAG: quinolinate phosphoribosyl transferase [Chloroflexi bacterium]|nr:quinolinate phosphoribosyl transferase [Chloroflexota bacterium]